MNWTGLKEAVRDALKGDEALALLMGAPADDFQRIYYLVPPARPAFPMVVFWLSGAEHDAEQGREIGSWRARLDVVAWAKDAGYEAIAERVVALLHQRSGLEFRFALDVGPQELYDQETDAYGRHVAFRAFHRGGIL